MIRFRKLFSSPKRGESAEAIVCYAKHPETITMKEVEYDLDVPSNQTYYEFVNQYRKFLQIDLWIVILLFVWKTKYRE